CGSGCWSSPDWDSGIPCLSIHAASGAPSAVITSDFVTAEKFGNYIDVFQTLWSSRTVGEATSHLNEIRPYAAGEFAYYLLGDPEGPVGASRWSGWCAEATIARREELPEQQLRFALSAPVGTPYVRANLGPVAS